MSNERSTIRSVSDTSLHRPKSSVALRGTLLPDSGSSVMISWLYF